MKQKTPTNKNENKKSLLPQPQFYGTAVVGTKGQIVIPKELRSASNIKTGDTMILILGQSEVIALIKTDQLNEILKNTKDLFKI